MSAHLGLSANSKIQTYTLTLHYKITSLKSKKQNNLDTIWFYKQIPLHILKDFLISQIHN